MALITCPDCANQYSDDAPYCPNCGRPNPARASGAANAQPETPAPPAGNTFSQGTGSTGSTASTGSTGQAGSSGGSTYGAGSAGETPAGGAYAGGGAPGGGYGGGAPGGGYGGAPGGGGGYGGGPAGGPTGYAGGSPPQQIPNYLVHAILTTLCCCLPLGIVSIIYATQVNTKRDAGDIAGAWEASKNAKKWAMIAAGVGVVWLIIVIAMNGLAFLAALAGGGTTSNY